MFGPFPSQRSPWLLLDVAFAPSQQLLFEKAAGNVEQRGQNTSSKAIANPRADIRQAAILLAQTGIREVLDGAHHRPVRA